MIWSVLNLIGGLVLLIFGADALVRGAVALALRIGVSPMMAGLVIVGFGTSTPEMLTSVRAALAGSPGIAIGNVVGSNIANILLILGLTSLIRPIACDTAALRRDGAVMAAAAVACTVLAVSGSATRPIGAVFTAALLAYVAFSYVVDRRRASAAAEMHSGEINLAEPGPASIPIAFAMTTGGLIATVVGANLLVDGSIAIARLAGVPETVIGLTLVAVGTSVPELVTSIVAALRGANEIAFGNIVGSNIFNVFGVLGVTAVISPIEIPVTIVELDIWVMLAATAALLLFAATDRTLSRIEGGVFFGAYAAYLLMLFF